MLTWFVKKQLKTFERTWNYNTSYMREIVDEAGVDAVLPINGVQKMSTYRHDIPLAVYHAAKVASAVIGDCGPCAQLAVTMAERAGVDKGILRAVAANDGDAIPPDVRLGVNLARATLARDPSVVDIAAKIEQRWGKRALVSLAYGIVTAQIYPTLKYALGHGIACSRLRVGNEDVATKRLAAAV